MKEYRVGERVSVRPNYEGDELVGPGEVLRVLGQYGEGVELEVRLDTADIVFVDLEDVDPLAVTQPALASEVKFKVGDKVTPRAPSADLCYGREYIVAETYEDTLKVEGSVWSWSSVQWRHVADMPFNPATGNFERNTSEAARRKGQPVTSGVLDYFPDALLAISEVSRAGNEQHHPGKPLHWEKDKSTDHAECIVRHLLDRGTSDTDGSSHTAKVAWRALALLQTELESRDPALAARRQAQRDAAAKGERK